MGQQLPRHNLGKLGINFYMKTSGDRVRLLIKQASPKRLSEVSPISHDRWKSISKGAIRASTEEIDTLVKIYPQYALWLASGQIHPECGQTSPDYDEANAKLAAPNAG